LISREKVYIPTKSFTTISPAIIMLLQAICPTIAFTLLPLAPHSTNMSITQLPFGVSLDHHSNDIRRSDTQPFTGNANDLTGMHPPFSTSRTKDLVSSEIAQVSQDNKTRLHHMIPSAMPAQSCSPPVPLVRCHSASMS